MSMPLSYPLFLYRGDSYRVQFALWGNLLKTDPIDLTGVTVAAEIRASSGQALLVTPACSVAANVITMTVTAAQSRSLPSAASWDLQLTYVSGDVQTIVAGPVDVRGDITQSAATGMEIAHV